MNHNHRLRNPQVSTVMRGLLALGLTALSLHAQAQSTNPNNPNGPPTETPPNTIVTETPTRPMTTPAPAATAINAATSSARDPLASSIDRALTSSPRSVGPRPATVTQAGTGVAVAESVRVLRAPGACTPKTNSLDCVQDSSQAGQGANVSGRVRNSVIGEVGTGRAATEGGGAAQRQQACTPKPGELTCTP